MDITTITRASFIVTRAGVVISGVVTYVDDIATFSPTSELALATTYVATVDTSATDLARNPLGAAHTWSFMTARPPP